MSDDLIRQVIETHVRDNFMTQFPDVAVCFENDTFKQPEDRSPWVYLTIVDNDAFRANIGNERHVKACGIVNAQIQVAEGTGTKRAKQIRDGLFAVLFDTQVPLPPIGHVTLSHVTKRTRGVINGWYSLTVMAEYRAYVQIS